MIDPRQQERLDTLIKSMGYELLGVEKLSQGRGSTFRLYVDKPGGVTLDDCAIISRQVSAMFDVDEALNERYTLEVSSPGVDRPLFKLEHFIQSIGKRVKIRLYSPIDGRRKFEGILQSVQGEDVHLLVEDVGQQITIPFLKIEKANLVGDLSI